MLHRLRSQPNTLWWTMWSELLTLIFWLFCSRPEKSQVTFQLQDRSLTMVHAHAKHGKRVFGLAGASVGLILISSVSWGSSIFECDTLRVVRPMQVAFPAYEDDVLTKVICFCMYVTDSAAPCCCIEHTVRVGLRTCIKMSYAWQD